MLQVVGLVRKGDDILSDSLDENLLNDVPVEVYGVFIGLFDHEFRVKKLHVEYVGIDLFQHEPIE